MNYITAYTKGRERLEEAGVPEAGTDAELLLMHVCKTDRGARYAHPDRELTESEEKTFLEVTEKRAGRIPLQHIIGTRCFMGLDFRVNENVLIPRDDTEILVEEVLKDGAVGASVLDICTGSGCIILSLLKYANESRGMGTDISEKALEVAKYNGEALGINADFVRSDIFSDINGKFDIITSNPPYIRSGEINGLMPEVKDHDPLLALDGGTDGLVFYRRIIKDAKDYLEMNGRLYLEIGFDQGDEVSGLCRGYGFKDIEIIKDYAGLPRVVKAHI